MFPRQDENQPRDQDGHLATLWQAADEGATTQLLEAEGYSFVLDD
jgi:hypothetical protein